MKREALRRRLASQRFSLAAVAVLTLATAAHADDSACSQALANFSAQLGHQYDVRNVANDVALKAVRMGTLLAAHVRMAREKNNPENVLALDRAAAAYEVAVAAQNAADKLASDAAIQAAAAYAAEARCILSDVRR